MIQSFALLAVVVFGYAATTTADVVEYTFDIREWVVDFKRPTVGPRVTPFKIPEENRKGAILVNGQYPGPTIDVFENDIVKINVINNMISEDTTLHWHGIHPFETPWEDGAVGVTMAGIRPGHNYTYEFRAWPAGTHYWHSHMDGTQSAKGLRGPFVVRKRPSDDPFAGQYDEEKLVVMSDEWQDPDVCLKLEGAMAGNDVCSDIDWASVNGEIATGQYQKFDKKYPYPLIDVEKGKCYRLRLIMMASNAENYIVSFAGHGMKLIALDGEDVSPINISSINMHIGERADVILCATEPAGYYPIQFHYDYACAMSPHGGPGGLPPFIPPGFHEVSSCRFYAFLHYKVAHEWTYGPPTSPEGTGGGKHPRVAPGVPFDLTRPADWKKTHMQKTASWIKPKPDYSFHVSLGLNGPLYKNPTDLPLTRGRWYMDIDGRRESWRKPDTPLLHTKNTCGNTNVPVLDIPEDAEDVEIILNNLSPTAHNIHLHGLKFAVTNVADFEWCNVNRTDCFLMPYQLNPCPKEDRAIADVNHTSGLDDFYWGCKYNEAKDRSNENLATPLVKDSFQIWQRSWAVLRLDVRNRPGVWQFHCHMEQHIPLGMVFALNILPSKQPPIPAKSPTEGPCAVVSPAGKTLAVDSLPHLQRENARLEQRIRDLESTIESENCGKAYL
eukprot:g1867.t1